MKKMTLARIVPVICLLSGVTGPAFAEDAEVKLNSNDGSTRMIVQDKNAAIVFSADSAGNIVVNGTATIAGSGFSVLGSTFIVNGGNVGIGTANPSQKLEVAGIVKAAAFQGDGSQLQNINVTGDGLGSHVATTTLQMGPYAIISSSNITAGRYLVNGNTVLALLPGNGSMGVGVDAGKVNSGNGGTFLGYQAGLSNLGPANNTFVGSSAGSANTTGWSNTFVGSGAGYSHTTGIQNTLLGTQAGKYSTTGNSNVVVGAYANANNLTGAANVIIGYNAALIKPFDSISSSTIVGYEAGMTMEAGAGKNLLLGYKAGDHISTGSGNIVLGYDQDTSAPAASDELNIGGAIFGNLASGNIGVGTAAPYSKLEVAGGDIAATTQGTGLILRATDGANCFRVTVNNAGALSTVSVPCP